MIVDIGIFTFVGTLCSIVGTHSGREYGQSLLVAGLGASMMGVLRVCKSAGIKLAREYQYALPLRRHGVRAQFLEEMIAARQSYQFFWFMTAVAAVAFVAGAIMQFI